jgi:TatD DNase family protein
VATHPMRLIDSHCHLTDERLAPEAPAIVERARAAGVEGMVTVGTRPEDWDAALDVAASLPGVFASLGVHPHTADRATPETLAELEARLAGARVVAVGETGLDYHYDKAPREAQRAGFARHLELGRRMGLPVIVHTRDADDDTAAILREAGQGTTGVLHCFTGGPVLMETALELGWYVSFAGMITFARYADADLVRAVPADRILVETDSPYLAPAPHRGRRNEPAYVAEVARHAATLRGEDPAALAAATFRNAVRLYGLDRLGVAAP